LRANIARAATIILIARRLPGKGVGGMLRRRAIN